MEPLRQDEGEDCEVPDRHVLDDSSHLSEEMLDGCVLGNKRVGPVLIELGPGGPPPWTGGGAQAGPLHQLQPCCVHFL